MLAPSEMPLAQIDSHDVAASRPSLLVRALPAIHRRVRLISLRLRYPRASFGARVDIRARFCLRQSDGAIVEIGERCVLDNDLTIECRGKLTIGDGTIFGHHCTIAAWDSVTIGAHCMLAEMVSIRDHNHVFDDPTRPYSEQGMRTSRVTIGQNVWLGAKTTVLAGVTIGDNAVIGANAVVTRDIPANSIAVGVPAKVIRRRDAAEVPHA